MPPLKSRAARALLLIQGRSLSRAKGCDTNFDAKVDKARRSFLERSQAVRGKERDALVATGLLLNDLRKQGWACRVRGKNLEIKPPPSLTDDLVNEKERIRRQELLRRDAQLEEPSVREFIRSMECSRLFHGKPVSIFSVIRDGRDLASALRGARLHDSNGWADALKSAIDPYIQVIESPEQLCAFTGLCLMNVWRYFRHTWTNQYTSAPGRGMAFLIRDRSHNFHAVVGIGALASPVVQLRVRDEWIGWQPDRFLQRVRDKPTAAIAAWMLKIVKNAIDEIYVKDFMEQGILSRRDLSSPSKKVIARLLKFSAAQRKKHHRFMRSKDHKKPDDAKSTSNASWIRKARTHLFCSKRALALATYLDCRLKLHDASFDKPTAEKIRTFSAKPQGADVLRKVLRKAKSDRVGISMADISVCGAIQPYNAILGGSS